MVDLNFEPGYVLAGSVAIAMVAIVLEALLPPTVLPWWGARRGFRDAARIVETEQTASAEVQPPEAVEAVITTAEPAPNQPPMAERRIRQIPFIGKDRRAAAQTTTEPASRQQNQER